MGIGRFLPEINILLVEDSPSDVELVRQAFDVNKVFNNIYVTENGVDALDFLYKRGKFGDVPRPNLILLDLNLPKKDGREVLAEIKADSSLKLIPVVVLTTSAAEQDILSSYQLQANCYITKPVDLEQFTAIILSIECFWLTVVKLPE